MLEWAESWRMTLESRLYLGSGFYVYSYLKSERIAKMSQIH